MRKRSGRKWRNAIQAEVKMRQTEDACKNLFRLEPANTKWYCDRMIDSSLIERMSVVERLQAMEQLWDALACQGGDMPSPEWHRDILADRKAREERGEAKFLTLGQLRSRLRGSET